MLKTEVIYNKFDTNIESIKIPLDGTKFELYTVLEGVNHGSSTKYIKMEVYSDEETKILEKELSKEAIAEYVYILQKISKGL